MKRVFSAISIAALGLVLNGLATLPAQAESDWQFRLMVPHVLVPDFEEEAYFNGRRDDARYYDEDEDEIVIIPRRRGFVYDEELDEWVPRKRFKRRGQMVYDETLDDWVPAYEPPRQQLKLKKQIIKKEAERLRRVEAAKRKAREQAREQARLAAAKKSVTPNKPAVVAAPTKPAVKKPAVQVASVSKLQTQPTPVVKAQSAQLASVAKPATTVAPKVDKPLQTASLPKPAGQAIGCTNGADIVAGYGFTSVRPKSCSGATYTFDAKRTDKAYVISVSSATGEVTDVRKIN